MPGEDEGTKTYTQEQVDAAIAEANEGLEANRNEVLADLRKAKDQLKTFGDIDPKEHRDLKAKISALETQAKAEKAGITSQELDKMRADVRAQIEDEYTPLRGEVDVLKRENRELKLDNVVKAAMGSSGVRAERIDALFRLAGDRFDLTDDGKPMLSSHPAKDVKRYLAEELEAEYPEFYVSSKSSGGSAPKSVSSGTGRVREIARDDPDAFMANLEGIARGEITVAD